MPAIFSTHALHPRAAGMLAAAGDLRIASAPDGETLLREADDPDIIIVRAPLPEKLFEAPRRLRAAIRHGAGLDMIPIDAATRAGVLVANVPGVNARTVAEHVVFASIALLRRFRQMDGLLRTTGWAAGRALSNLSHDLSGRRLGIVGFGNVARELHAIARHGFGLDVAAFTRRRETLPEDVAYLELDALIAQSDILVLCCPLTPETRGLIDRRRLGLMQAGAIIVNVSRGPVVEEGALVEALQAGRIGGAALDVFDEQPLPAGHPLWSFDNAILTPHAAGITEESMARMGIGAAREAILVLAGGLPVNLCNREAVHAYRGRFPEQGPEGIIAVGAD